MNFKISIIIPVYNVESYIIDCLQSVANQTMTNGVECIIIDDCGCDKSIELAENFIDNYIGDISFRILHHVKNMGLSAARNTGICEAEGDYLFFLDSDDKISEDCLEIMYSKSEQCGKVDLVQGSFYTSEEERLTRTPHLLPEYTNDKTMIKSFLLRFESNIVKAQNRLIRKSFLINNQLFFKEGIIHEDNYWTFFLSKFVNTMSYCHIPTYFYNRDNPNSITCNINFTKEAIAYKTIIEDTSSQIDSFLSGHQKEWILNNLLVAINCHYYHTTSERKQLIETFARHNTFFERLLLYSYFLIKNTKLGNKILHLLLRIYMFSN